MISLNNETPLVETAGLEDAIASGKEAIKVYPPTGGNTIKNSVLFAALQLAEQGLPVFPCRADKAPACPGGFKAASTDPEAVKALWRNSLGALIGVPTGTISGIDVLDIDPRHGGDKWFEDNRTQLPAARTHQTKSGGWHLLFRHHEGMRNSASKIAQGVDTRGDGGYIIWWPASGLPVANATELAAWPNWLLAELMPPPRGYESPPPCRVTGTRYARAALRRACNAVANAPEGCRNDTFNRECWSLLRLATSEGLNAQDIATALAAAALSAGLTRREIISTLSSALRSRGIA